MSVANAVSLEARAAELGFTLEELRRCVELDPGAAKRLELGPDEVEALQQLPAHESPRVGRPAAPVRSRWLELHDDEWPVVRDAIDRFVLDHRRDLREEKNPRAREELQRDHDAATAVMERLRRGTGTPPGSRVGLMVQSMARAAGARARMVAK
jgi:hypothetical protein